jgi:hypothetical protein
VTPSRIFRSKLMSLPRSTKKANLLSKRASLQDGPRKLGKNYSLETFKVERRSRKSQKRKMVMAMALISRIEAKTLEILLLALLEVQKQDFKANRPIITENLRIISIELEEGQLFKIKQCRLRILTV